VDVQITEIEKKEGGDSEMPRSEGVALLAPSDGQGGDIEMQQKDQKAT